MTAFVVDMGFAVKILELSLSGMWRNYENSMQRHILMHNKPTYPNIAHVKKKESTTSKRAPNQTLTIEYKAIIKPSCGSLKISTPHKEKRTLA
jgi:hypothetical protein